MTPDRMPLKSWKTGFPEPEPIYSSLIRTGMSLLFRTGGVAGRNARIDGGYADELLGCWIKNTVTIRKKGFIATGKGTGQPPASTSRYRRLWRIGLTGANVSFSSIHPIQYRQKAMWKMPEKPNHPGFTMKLRCLVRERSGHEHRVQPSEKLIKAYAEDALPIRYRVSFRHLVPE